MHPTPCRMMNQSHLHISPTTLRVLMLRKSSSKILFFLLGCPHRYTPSQTPWGWAALCQLSAGRPGYFITGTSLHSDPIIFTHLQSGRYFSTFQFYHINSALRPPNQLLKRLCRDFSYEDSGLLCLITKESVLHYKGQQGNPFVLGLQLSARR